MNHHKKQCLAHFLEVPIDEINGADNGIEFRYEYKTYMVATWPEVLKKFSSYIEENIWDINLELLQDYISLPSHVDSSEFYDSLREMAENIQANSNPIILAFINDLDDFTESFAESTFNNDLGDIFAIDETQVRSDNYPLLYIYRTK